MVKTDAESFCPIDLGNGMDDSIQIMNHAEDSNISMNELKESIGEE